MEALSDVLRLFRLNVDVYHNAQSCGNWRHSETHLGKTSFHMVTKGACKLNVPGEIDTILNHGDLVLFPREIPHVMCPINEEQAVQTVISFDQAGDLAGTGLLCGEACFDHSGSFHLLDALPAVFIVRHFEDNEWSCALIKLIMSESVNPSIASSSVLNRLSELIFVYAIRQYILSDAKSTGVLALYGHARLHRAINAIHNAPEKDWTLELLAQIATMSRTAFAEAFRNTSGWTAMKYLAWWRMQLAWSKLNEGSSSAEVAMIVGYQSEAAFSRAFKKQFGVTAGKIRRGNHR